MIIKIKGTGVGQVGPHSLLWGHGQPLPPTRVWGDTSGKFLKPRSYLHQGYN